MANVQLESVGLSRIRVVGSTNQPIAEYDAKRSEPVILEPGDQPEKYADLTVVTVG
jgi:hypothetical protein